MLRFVSPARKAQMATLHIEHSISDLPTWLGAFNRFEEAREQAGVRAQRVHQPVDDDKYIYVDLDFDSLEQAAAFKRFLEETVWASAEASPALAGTPTARILTDVTVAQWPALTHGSDSTSPPPPPGRPRP
jgi:hypothetical protein